MKRIGVFTSGGDSPGMNAAVRAVVRTATFYKMEVVGIMYGYEGMINGDMVELRTQDVANIIQRGGTILKSMRCDEFRTKEGRKKAYDNLVKNEIDGVVAIGGDGTFTGAKVFTEEYGIPFIGVPGTIDNDLVGTDFTIGYDSAINTIVEAVDKVRDTADSHNRLFIIEVMGRDAGFIALRSGIGVGAEAILVPEYGEFTDELVAKLDYGKKRKKLSSIVIVGEGNKAGGAVEIAEMVKSKYDKYDTRVLVLGHLQRGGAPTCMDRVRASQMGMAAVEALMNDHRSEMVGIINGQIVYTPFGKAIKHTTGLNPELLRMAEILSM